LPRVSQIHKVSKDRPDIRDRNSKSIRR
jgi:hypothetical protein